MFRKHQVSVSFFALSREKIYTCVHLKNYFATTNGREEDRFRQHFLRLSHADDQELQARLQLVTFIFQFFAQF